MSLKGFSRMADINLIIDYENGNIKVVTNEAENKFKGSGKKSGKLFADGFKTNLNPILGALKKIGAAASAVAGITLFKSVRDAAQLEGINTQFEVLLGSAAAAQKQVEELQDFAATTPFQLEGLSQATTQLISFGVAQKDVIPTLQQLGDIAAGAGAQITDLAIPFGRLVSTQRLTLQELDKFADRGINIYQALADQTGRSLKTIRDDISRGRIPFEEFEAALANLTGEAGIFFGGMQKQSRTLNGVLSTLGDNVFNLSANFGKAFSPLVVDIVDKITVAIQNVNKEVKENFNVFNDVTTPLVNFNEAFIQYFIAPLELGLNIGNFLFDSLSAGLARIISSFANLGLVIAEVLDLAGVGEGVSQTLKDIEETTEAAADQLALKVGESASSVFDFDISTKLAEKNEQLRTYFNEQQAIIAENNVIQDEQAQASIEKAAEQSQTFGDLLLDTFSNVNVGINQTKEQMAKVSQQTAAIVKGGLAQGISGGIQNIVQSLAAGEDVFANFGKFLLGTFGDLAIQLGSFFISQGIAVEALNAVSGTGAIAAGAALVALGSILKSFSGSGGASASSAGTVNVGGGSANGVFTSGDPELEEDFTDIAPAQRGTNISVVVEGNIRDEEAFTRQLVQDISEEGGRQGLRFENFATV
jgi:hypothetical protein